MLCGRRNENFLAHIYYIRGNKMKSFQKIIYWFLFLMVSLSFFTSKVEAKGKSLIVSQYNIDAIVSANGDVRFKEEITFQANGQKIVERY